VLNPEFAKARLQEYKNDRWLDNRIEKILQLPTELKSIGCGILGRHPDGKKSESDNYNSEYYKLKDSGYLQLCKLNSDDRLQLFTIVFPRFAEIVELAWQNFNNLPYQLGYSRRSFRDPQHSETIDSKRCQWFSLTIEILQGYEEDLVWLARWCPYLGYYVDNLGYLFASAIDRGDELGNEIFNILIASAKGEDEIGAVGRHITRALLVANRPEGWDFVEKLLIAAQRQEGLRQTILETVDEAHPIAFQRMLKLILNENLVRFAAVLRAIDVWFGFDLDVLNGKEAVIIIDRVLGLLTDVSQRELALVSDDPQTVYLGLWVMAFEDINKAITAARSLLSNDKVTHRFVAVHLLRQLGVAQARLILLEAIADPDIRVACLALNSISNPEQSFLEIVPKDTFETIESILPNFPVKEKTFEPLVWDWLKVTVSQELVASTLSNYLGERSPKLLIPYLSVCNFYLRVRIAEAIAKIKPWDEEIRDALFGLAGDISSYVRGKVFDILIGCDVEQSEIHHLVKLLTRKSSDLRRGIIVLLLKQNDENTITAARDLIAAKNTLQRQAGLELLAEMVKVERSIKPCQDIARKYQFDKAEKLNHSESQLIDRILLQNVQQYTLKDSLGLINIDDLTKISPPQKKNSIEINTHAAKQTLLAIDELIHQHHQTPVQITDYQGEKIEYLLGNLDWSFPRIDYKLSQAENLARLPLADVWENWWQGERSRDEDGGELIRAIAPRYRGEEDDTDDEESDELFIGIERVLVSRLSRSFAKHKLGLRYPIIVDRIIDWLLYLYPDSQLNTLRLDILESVLNIITPTELANSIDLSSQKVNWYLNSFLESIVGFARLQKWSSETDFRRWWHAIQWVDFSAWSKFLRFDKVTTLHDILTAISNGLANRSDLIDFLIGDRLSINDRSRNNFNILSNLTRRKLPENTPLLAIEVACECRDRILAIECDRGELATPATEAALCLRSIEGIPTVVKLLKALDSKNLSRSTWNRSKEAVISRLMRVSFPTPEDTPDEFARQVKEAKISEEKLIQFALFAPQWANYIQKALNFPAFTEGVWWIHAHTKDSNWYVERDIREIWDAQISERTPLSARSLYDGAVDVEWFDRIYKIIGETKWLQIDEAAKYASSGSGHQRAKQFASAMLGKIEIEKLIDRVTNKRHQDSVRALGLCPLGKGKKRDKEIIDRYQIYQEFLRTSKKFGSQRRTSEKLAIDIGMENLARTAGYADPIRLQWAMEAAAVADLAQKPQTITIEETSITLNITDRGKPEITITKAGKPLKAIPAKLKKNPEIQALKSREREITKQASRMCLSLEEAMCRGDAFTKQELQQLAQHPVLAPMLRPLVLISVEGENNPDKQPEMGYIDTTGKNLIAPDNTLTVTASHFRIAHPHDLFASRQWQIWQQDCFEKQRQQPFKQIFRELYIPTAAERAERYCKRYEGHQLNPKQAIALFGQRGWIASPDEGVRRTFHREGIIASVSFLNGYYTPLDIDGLTIDSLSFYYRDKWEAVPLKEIPPRIFSEIMRDLDLAVSVAHIGGVDPEASASTVEMRSTVLRETMRLMKLTNVTLQSNHALIKGELGDYSVHLGSAIVHRQPGGALCILPVSSQHRGRIFLPFIDNDPKTAELISKVLLLAKDKDIKDPTILEQILAK
jgi:hypothetical protein